MAYRIVYGKSVKRKRFIPRKKWIFSSLRIGVMIALLLSALAFPQGRQWIREISLPGDNAVTKEAVEHLVQDLKSGERFDDALEVFCQEILHNG